MSDYVVVSTAVGQAEDAGRLAEAVVDARLAACVQILSAKSTYRWQGQVEHADEALLLMKTRRECAGPLMKFVRERHQYEVPELTVTNIEAGSPDYLRWIHEETESSGKA